MHLNLPRLFACRHEPGTLEIELTAHRFGSLLSGLNAERFERLQVCARTYAGGERLTD